MLFLWCRSIGDFEHSDWSIFKNHWRHCRGKFIKVVVLLTTFLTLPLHPLPHCLSPSFLSILTTSPSFLSIHFLTTSLSLSLSLSFILLTSSLPPSSVILTTTLLSSSQSSSLLLSLLPIHPPHYLSPSFLSVILTTSLPPSSQSSSPPLHPSFLSICHLITSSLSCNIIIHLITSVFLPSSSSLLTLPNCLLRILFSSVLILLLITSSSLLLSSSFTFVTSSFLSSSSPEKMKKWVWGENEYVTPVTIPSHKWFHKRRFLKFQPIWKHNWPCRHVKFLIVTKIV